MKKSVLIALLGLQAVEGIKVNSQPSSQAASQHKSVDAKNATNASKNVTAKFVQEKNDSNKSN